MTEHGSTTTEDIDRVWRLMEKMHVCMLASRDGEKIRARPMAPTPRRESNAIYFLTSAEGDKDEEIARDPNVCLSFAKPSSGAYLVVTGKARLVNDNALVRALWNTAAEAWWNGPDDPRVRVIEVTPEDAQFWEGPHGLAASVQMILAATSAMPPAMGDQRKVDLH